MTPRPADIRLPRSFEEGSSARRLAIASRLLAALAGGYLIANTFAILLARTLLLMSFERADGVMIGVIISFPIYAGAVLWAFAARSAMRAWLGLLSIAGVFGAVAWLLGNGAAV
jgi:hypothetical protein